MKDGYASNNMTDQTQSKYAFAVTSAINTKFGVYTTEQRLQQTIDTMRSIKSRVPDARIIVLESGNQKLSDEQFKALAMYASFIIDFTSEEDVKQIHSTINNHDIVKNVTEMLCFIKFLKLADANKVFEGVERVFKISGRYQLNDNFNIADYEDKAGKIVVKTKYASQFPFETTQIAYQYMTRLWSFDVEMVPSMIDQYTNMLQYCVSRVNAGGYADIEHCLYHFSEVDKVVEVPTIGVTGNIAPNGMAVED